MEVDEILMIKGGSGYTPAYPIVVSIQPPEECGGVSGKDAKAEAQLNPAKFRDDPRPSISEQSRLGMQPLAYRLEKFEEDVTGLLPFKVRLAYNGKKFEFVETSALGINITTPFGPRNKVPVLKEEQLGGGEFVRIATAGGLCAAIAHGSLVPLDTIKLKLQTAKPGKYKNLVDASIVIMTKEGGAKTFVNGFQPEFLGSAVYGFLSFGGTEMLRRALANELGPVIALQYPVAILVVSSCLASAFAALVSCPFQAVKIRMVADDQFGPGGNMIGGFQRIYREEGPLSFVQGVAPFIFKDVTFVLSKFSVFDIVSKSMYFYYPELSEDISLTLLVSLVAGTVAGTCAAITSQPGDYIFSKANEIKGANVASAWKEYTESKKWGAIFTGLGPRLIYGGVLIALQFVIYDYCRVLFHVSPGELNVFLDVVAGLAKNQ